MSTHLGQYNNPQVQAKIIAILWMSPIYAVTSFLGLLLPAADGYLSVLKDFYEAFVIYNFLGFLVAVLGKEGAVRILASDDHLNPPSKWLSRFYEEPPDASPEALARAVLTECQILALQFVFIRPLTSIASFICTALEAQEPQTWAAYVKSPKFFISMIVNVSVFFAFTGLLKFYHAVRSHLAWLNPFSKFMSVKGIVFLTFWQGLLISILVHLQATDNWDNNALHSTNTTATASTTQSDDETPQDRAAELQNILICLEMLFFAVAHWCVFPADEWKPGYEPKEYANPGLGLGDFASDVRHIVRGRAKVQTDEEQYDEDDENYPTDSTIDSLQTATNDDSCYSTFLLKATPT